jgi:predicted permease
MFAWGSTRFNLERNGEARYAEGLWVSGDYFHILGIAPAAGRLLNASDDTEGCATPAAVISYPFWQREYGGDPTAIGRQVFLGGYPAEIVGVSPSTFWGVEVGRFFDIAVPLCARAALTPGNNPLKARDVWWLAAIGRLKPGWSVERASSDLRDISPALFEGTLPRYPAIDSKNYLQFTLITRPAPSGPSTLRRDYETSLWLLIAMTGLVLLIACANIANLTLARASARRRELSIRLAIGASRKRLIAQLLIESFLLASTGASFGIVLASPLSRILVSSISTQNNPLSLTLEMDWRTLTFVAGLTVLTTLLFGLIPALRATRTAPEKAIRSDGRGLTAGRERFRLQRILVVSQVALSFVLLLGALLCVRSLRNLRTTDLGFLPHGLITVNVDVSQFKLSEERRRNLFQQLEDRLRAAPLATATARILNPPIMGSWSNRNIFLDSASEGKGDRLLANFNEVGPGYFETAGTQLLTGRDFNDRDMVSSPLVAVVDESFSRKFMNGANPVGKRFQIEKESNDRNAVTGVSYEIIGMVRNSKYTGIRDDFAPTIFLSLNQDHGKPQDATYMIRSAAAPAVLIPLLKHAISEISPDTTIDFRLFDNQISELLIQDRLVATLASFFGFLAAVLAAIGVYGMLSYAVSQRRNEIGIRVALGAERTRVVAMILKETSLLVLIGLSVGIPMALMSARYLTSILFGLKPGDPSTIGLAIVGLCAVTLGASYLPARRAATVDPATVLREE